MSPVRDVAARPLPADHAVEAQLAAGEVHAYELQLAAGEYVHLRAVQAGADVALHWFDPAGTRVTGADLPQANRGAEDLHVLTAAAGSYRLEVHEAGIPGRYILRLEARRPATEEDRTRVLAEAELAAGEDLRRRKMWQPAKDRYAAALPGFEVLRDGERQAQVWDRVGWMDVELDRPDEARLELRRAASLFAEADAPFWRGTSLLRLGSLLLKLGEWKAAVDVLEPLVGELEGVDEPDLLAGALSRLADGYRYTDRLEEALESSRRALGIFTRRNKRDGQQSNWLRLGELYLLQSELGQAADAFQRARELAVAAGWQDREAQSLTYLADVLDRQGRPGEALQPAQRALDLRREREDRHGEAVSLSILGTVRMDLGDTDAAGRDFDAALRIFHEIGDSLSAARVVHKQGRLRRAEGDLEASLALHQQAAEALAAAGDTQGVASARYGAALALRDLGRFWDAKQEAEEALRQVAGLVGESQHLDLRASYVDGRFHYWELYVDVLMHMDEQEPDRGFAALALAAGEAARAKGLAQVLSAAGAGRGDDVPPELRAPLEAANLRLGRAEAARREARSGSPAAQSAERELFESLAELRGVRARIRGALPLLSGLENEDDPFGRGHVGRIEKLRQHDLGAGTLVLVYSLGEPRSFVWILTRDGLRSGVLPARKTLEQAALQLAEQLPSQAPSVAGPRRASAAYLSHLVLAPVAEALAATGRGFADFRRLAVVSDGALSYVPFAALPLPGAEEPMIRHMEVLRLPSVLSLGSLRRLSHRRRVAPKTLAVLADPVVSADDRRLPAGVGSAAPSTPSDEAPSLRARGATNLTRLPGSGREARALADMVDPDSRLLAVGFDASRETALSGHLADYRILHFATHSLLDEGHPELSSLVLSRFAPDGEPIDGDLRLYEIYDLQLSARLVVLSACRTGLGRNLRGEGMVGLARGFMYAGVPRVVVSLWNVDDDATAELMTRFYRAMLEDGQSPSAALRGAQLALLDEYGDDSVSRWAGFELLGDWTGRLAVDDPIEGADTAGGTDPPPETPGDPLPTPGGDGRKTAGGDAGSST